MSLAVRRAARADMERLAEVHVRCWQETYRGTLSEGFLASQTHWATARQAYGWLLRTGARLVSTAMSALHPTARRT